MTDHHKKIRKMFKDMEDNPNNYSDSDKQDAIVEIAGEMIQDMWERMDLMHKVKLLKKMIDVVKGFRDEVIKERDDNLGGIRYDFDE
jgi:uncharacterized ferritin-like protein (DUF455 family)